MDLDALIGFTSELVAIPSVLGDESAVAQRVVREMEELGYRDVGIDRFGNVTGVIAGEGHGPTLLLDAHLDTVDVHPREAWSRDPFGGEVSEVRVWGRGASDMKGALAAMVHGIAQVDRSRLAGRVVVSGSVGEEQIEGAALHQVMDREKPDLVVIGEASGLDLVRGGRGRVELTITTRGRPAHASSPSQGKNAVHEMERVSAELRRLPMPEHEFLGQGVMCLTDIISVPYPAHSVVPSGCRATWERRLLPGDTEATVLAEVTAACERARAPETTVELAETDYRTESGIEWRQPKWFPPWEISAEHHLVERVLEALREIGQEPKLTGYQFCTNAAYSAGVAGVPTIGYGPSREDLVHIIDEFVEIDQLSGAANGYRAIAESVLELRPVSGPM